jgi:PhoPQ-activated pathogenicity-related protein
LADLVNLLAAFSRYQIDGKSMPDLKWKHESVNGKLRLTIEATPAPVAARLWVAQSPTQDFRAAKWQEQAVTLSKNLVVGEVSPPEKGHLAFYGEVDYEIDGLRYHLSTQVRMTE